VLVHNANCGQGFIAAEALSDAAKAGTTATSERVLLAEAEHATVTVTRWGRPGLIGGDWVMKGGKSRWNWIFSGKFQPKWVPTFGLGKNIPAKFAVGEVFQVPESALRWPDGFVGKIKGLLGQRIFDP
jgi:hypothetical protein